MWREVYRESASHQLGSSPVLRLLVTAYYTEKSPCSHEGVGVINVTAWDGFEREIEALDEWLGAEVFFEADYSEVIRRAQRALRNTYRQAQQLAFDAPHQEWYNLAAEVAQ